MYIGAHQLTDWEGLMDYKTGEKIPFPRFESEIPGQPGAPNREAIIALLKDFPGEIYSKFTKVVNKMVADMFSEEDEDGDEVEGEAKKNPSETEKN